MNTRNSRDKRRLAACPPQDMSCEGLEVHFRRERVLTGHPVILSTPASSRLCGNRRAEA